MKFKPTILFPLLIAGLLALLPTVGQAASSAANAPATTYQVARHGKEQAAISSTGKGSLKQGRALHFFNKQSRQAHKAAKHQKSHVPGGKSQIVALLLCIFLGYLGVHRFYLGYTGLGVLYIFTLGLFGIGWLIDTILLIIPRGLTPKGMDSYRD